MYEILATVSAVVIALGAWTFGVIFFVALLEGVVGIGMVVPGSTLMVIFGIIAAHQNASVFAVIVWAAIGAVSGDHISYYLGRRYGTDWLSSQKWPFSLVDPEVGKQYFQKHGAHSVFLASFVPVVNKVIPFTAGSLSMDKKQFFIYNVLGVTGWATVWVGLGYIFGHSLHIVERWITRVDAILITVFLVYVAYLLYRYVSYRLSRA